MAICKFHIADWRDMMRICGAIVATCPKNHNKVCEYVTMHFSSGECTAYGSNGFQCSKVTVPCGIAGNVPEQYILIPPMKTPPRTKTVEMHVPDNGGAYDIIFLDEDDDIVSASVCDMAPCVSVDFEQFFVKAQENFNEYNYGEGRYCIAVNPKYLLNALDGLKSCDTVILNFGSQVQPFTVRPMGGSPKACAYVLPVRTSL